LKPTSSLICSAAAIAPAALRMCTFGDIRDLRFVFQQDDEADVHFEPVIKLTEQVETKTHEEDEETTFKMYVA
jgi:hypothetical protein